MPRAYNSQVTDRQWEIYTYCVDFFKDEHQIPPMQAIADNFDFSSNNAAHEHMKALERQGYFTRNILNGYKFTELDWTDNQSNVKIEQRFN